jgi:hypothetical protein
MTVERKRIQEDLRLLADLIAENRFDEAAEVQKELFIDFVLYISGSSLVQRSVASKAKMLLWSVQLPYLKDHDDKIKNAEFRELQEDYEEGFEESDFGSKDISRDND